MWHITDVYLYANIYTPSWGWREAYTVQVSTRDDFGVTGGIPLLSVYVDDTTGLIRDTRVYTGYTDVEHCEEMHEVLGHQGPLINLTEPQVREKLAAIVAELRLRFL